MTVFFFRTKNNTTHLYCVALFSELHCWREVEILTNLTKTSPKQGNLGVFSMPLDIFTPWIPAMDMDHYLIV